jgi:hypothetical protein
MEPSTIGDDLNEVSVIANVAHRLLVSIRDDVETDPTLQSILDDLNAAHEQLDLMLEHIGTAIDAVDALADRRREQRPAIH